MLFARKYFVQFGAMRVIKVKKKKKKVNLKKIHTLPYMQVK